MNSSFSGKNKIPDKKKSNIFINLVLSMREGGEGGENDEDIEVGEYEEVGNHHFSFNAICNNRLRP
jgi:hypothetical protein